MTIAIQFATVADSISKISVSGLTIQDIDEITAKSDERLSIMLPLPDYITEFVVERDSFGGANAKMTAKYNLNYRLLYTLAGAGRSGKIEYFNGLIAMVASIFNAILSIDTMDGAITIDPNGVKNMGPVNDPSDNEWYGCDISFAIMEFIN